MSFISKVCIFIQFIYSKILKAANFYLKSFSTKFIKYLLSTYYVSVTDVFMMDMAIKADKAPPFREFIF